MIYILCLCEGYKNSHQLASLVGSEKVQPIELEDVIDEHDLHDIENYLDVSMEIEAGDLYMFVDYTSPVKHRNVFDAFRGRTSVIVAREI